MAKIITDLKEFYAKIDSLREVKVDKDYYLVYYIDESNGEKWVEEHPEAEYHGGGLPHLRLLDQFPWE